MIKQPSTSGSTDSTTQDVFADFEAPQTTDGSYKGTMKRIKATEEHLERKFDAKLKETNQRLKDAKTRVSITRKGNSLQLQATLPPKPDSDKTNPYQQLISLGIPANLDGLRTAEEEANELGKLLARKQFEWNEKYLGSKKEEIKIRTIGQLFERFEVEYFKTRKRTLPSENTFRTYSHAIRKSVGFDCLATQKCVEEKLEAKTPSIRYSAIVALNVLFRTFNIDIKIAKDKRYEPQPRDIPSDANIVLGYLKYEEYFKTNKKGRKKDTHNNWYIWRWIYGMLATYGLRPRELFVASNLDWWMNEDNVNHTWKVDKQTKTGHREVVPFVPNWIDLFELKNPTIVSLVKEYLKNKTNVNAINGGVSHNATWFRKIGLSFEPYDLRHACAIRAHLEGIPVKLSADNLGHSVEQHTETYQRWIGIEVRLKAMNSAIAKHSQIGYLQEISAKSKLEIELLQEENIALKLENEHLKIENERYRLICDNQDLRV